MTVVTSKTRRELIDAVLDSLGVLIPGQAPSDEAVARVDDVLDPVLAQVAADDILYVQDPGTSNPPSGGQIDLAIFLPLADIVAWNIAGAFNSAGDPSLKVKNDLAEKTLRRIGRPARTRKTLQTDSQLRTGNRRRMPFNFITGK